MLNPKLQMLHDTLKRLVRRSASGPLERVLAKAHVADLAFLMPHFAAQERRMLFKNCPNDEKRGGILAESDSDVAAQIVEILPDDQQVRLLTFMEPDDISDLLEHLPENVAARLLVRMAEADRSEVEDLARYDSATAGGIMSPRFIALNRDTTAKDAIAALHSTEEDVEMAFYIYVVNEVNQLLGVVSLRQLVTAKPQTTLFEIMTSDIVHVTPDVDQEEVAKLASRYGLLAVPVVNGANKLLGIVTIDDVIDVLREEATEDILRMAGAGDELAEHNAVLSAAVKRFPWILATAVGGALGALLLGAFAPALKTCLPLVYFIPVLLALGGVIGGQSATFIAQSITHGRQDLASMGRAFARQVSTGVLLGVGSGVSVSGFAWLWTLIQPEIWTCSRPMGITTLVGLCTAIAAAMSVVSALGVVLPLLLVRIRVDPAVAAGPFVAIGADLIGLVLYLAIAAAWV